MSHNLVELIRRHHEQGAPTALEVLTDALEHHGEITDDDRRLAAQRSGLPEAAVYGVSTFDDDLLAPRGRRHARDQPIARDPNTATTTNRTPAFLLRC